MSVSFRNLAWLVIVSTVCAIVCNSSQGNHYVLARTEDPLSTFELEPGFKIELLASDPLISDPVDMEIDEYGRLYVVEMHGYPLDKTGSGKIKLVSDSDGDGIMDKSTVFAEGLILPNSIMRWKKGVLVTDAPHVYYLEDTSNDGRADIKKIMLTGFALSNPQHNLNSPVLGIDNWIYLAHEGAVSTQTYKEAFGDPGTEVYYPDHPEIPRLPKNASGRSVRFRPERHLLENTSGNTQFGHTFDHWGHRFLVGNANHISHEVIGAAYLERNPDLLVSNAMQSLSDHKNAADVFPITKNPQHQLLTDVGVITSACGITAYLGGAFPARFDSVTFVAEPVSNLIHADVIKDNGATFTASRLHADKEFLASTDSWFRPVNMYIGPDGALYVVDYYRQIIEHPEWMDEEVIKSGKLYNGADKGRIYRITPTGARPADWMRGIKLGSAPDEELVSELSNPNIWWRLNAQRLLVDHANKKVVPILIQMAETSSSAMARLHAMWTLEGLGELTSAVIKKALSDPVAGIRENAIKIAELHLASSPELENALLLLKNDPDAKVRYQLLTTLGSVNSREAVQVRSDLLFRDIHDEWVQVAALSASASQAVALLNAVIDSFKNSVPAYASLVKRLGMVVGGRENEQVIRELMAKAVAPYRNTNSAWQGPLLLGLSQGLRNQPSQAVLNAEKNRLIEAFFTHKSSEVREGSLALLKVMGFQDQGFSAKAGEKAASIAGDRRQLPIKRVESIRLLALTDPTRYKTLLQKLIAPAEQSVIQVAALQTLGAIPGNTVSVYLLNKWPDLTPEIRNEAINTFMVNRARIAMLLNALQSGKIQVSEIGWPRSVRLMAQSDINLRNQARRLLSSNDSELKKINQEYQHVLRLTGDAAKGRRIFNISCSSCHQVKGEEGFYFGPDLGTIRNWSADAIMANILSPNLSIASGFDLWAVELRDGSSFQGIIASETPAAITLRNAGREERTVSRANIRSLKALNLSSMPSGFEKQINEQEMADLLAFLKQNK